MLYMDFVLRVALSMVLGFLIGLERQLTGHPAGIRINVLICMGTSFFTLFPMLYGSDQVFRVGSSIISGVGFLCSGVIFKDSGSVRGMNTAATLWCTAAIGILASTGMYAMAVTAAVLLISSNLILRPLARKVNPSLPERKTKSNTASPSPVRRAQSRSCGLFSSTATPAKRCI
mgnify:CR=1 FL=1